MLPETRQEAIEYCLRSLGAPVININVALEQINDRVDQALRYWHEYHFDSTEDTYRLYKVKERIKYSTEKNPKTFKTKDDQKEYYIELENYIWGVRNVQKVAGNMYADNFLFDFNYYMTVDAIHTTQSMSSSSYGIRDGLSYYHQAKEYLSLANMELGNKLRWNFSKYKNEIIFQTKINCDVVLVECTKIIDPELYSKVWSDIWFLGYLEALIQEQWAKNLIKFKNATLAGGVTIDADNLLVDAQNKIRKFEEQLQNDQPPLPIIIA